MLEGGETADARVARAYIGGGAGVRHQLVARQAEAAARQDMGVEVDETGQDELPGGVERLGAARCGDLRLDGGNEGIANPDVAPPLEVLPGIQHLATAHDKVEGIVRSEWRGARGSILDKPGGRYGGTGAAQQASAREVFHGIPRLVDAGGSSSQSAGRDEPPVQRRWLRLSLRCRAAESRAR